MSSKKGDLVITIDPSRTRGTKLRIVVEAKDRPMPLGRMTAELAQARVNRSAAVALAVFTPHTAPSSVTPLALVGPDVFTTYDAATDDAVALEAAYRAARILALLTLRDAGPDRRRGGGALTRGADAPGGRRAQPEDEADRHRLDGPGRVHRARRPEDRRPSLRPGPGGQLAVVENASGDALTA